ncbi:hypothetical protein M413DRAFT_89409 [Hebeloma cylindrosporum]|uniref:Uncharacterized protein n=1 Tax=Hebeloma cylindrosporum TaxID=76867 RepID=A0A0C3CJJ7_HEBCY|nr:hypothetical protein M413DRAFT_89409 [Hebeloma cylindrosporum h7]
MLKHRGFSAWIESNGNAVPEYLVALDETANRVSCWIPGIEGQTFTVYWQDHGGTIDSCAFITLDGLVVPGRFLFGDGIASRGGVRVSKSSEKPFIFQKVPENVSESPLQSSGKDAGMIILKIKRIRRVAVRPANSLQSLPSSVLGKRKVGDLSIGFGQEVKAYEQYDTTWQVTAYEDETPGAKPSTYVSFVFRYRSPEFLEIQGIAMEEKKSTQTPKRSSRRIASLPPHLRCESEELEKPPIKRPRMVPSMWGHAFPTDARRPSAELRRTVSWTATQQPMSQAAGEGQFFLPRQSRYAPPITSIRLPGGSSRSESPGTASTSGESKF